MLQWFASTLTFWTKSSQKRKDQTLVRFILLKGYCCKTSSSELWNSTSRIRAYHTDKAQEEQDK